ncbi:hypothetical protein BHE74_00017200 [Ensete ventricosum]|nr:hypothetical protein GW17_00007772 [Ensete ventricosum]RWW74838.1 hypothetical protein BHE74_00017200 [Ensete ventricosum]RZR98321.1 hypothetical protein BHM03_00027650 [Ensete ventricosum]
MDIGPIRPAFPGASQWLDANRVRKKPESRGDELVGRFLDAKSHRWWLEREHGVKTCGLGVRLRERLSRLTIVVSCPRSRTPISHRSTLVASSSDLGEETPRNCGGSQ